MLRIKKKKIIRVFYKKTIFQSFYLNISSSIECVSNSLWNLIAISERKLILHQIFFSVDAA